MKIENIKFKAKRLDNGEWIEGEISHFENTIWIVPIDHKPFHSGCAEVDPDTICMFTGLKDCKGREVWEGDILQDVDDDNIKYVVTFNEGTFLARKEGLYIGIPLHECVGSLGNDVITYAKVVGNKFDKEK
jgi:hypothetical protein